MEQVVVNALITGSLYALAAIGLSLSYSLMKVLNFSHAHMLTVAGYAFYSLSIVYDYGPFVAVLGTLVFTSLLGLFILEIGVFPLSNFASIIPFVTTFSLGSLIEAFLVMIYGISAISFGSNLLGNSWFDEPIKIAQVTLTPLEIILLLITGVLLFCLASFLKHTSLGRNIRALSSNRYAAEALGLNFKLTSRVIMVISCCFVTVAGIFLGIQQNLSPTSAGSTMIRLFTIIIIGGVGSVTRTAFSSYILAFLEHISVTVDVGRFSIPSNYRDAAVFLIALVFLYSKKRGENILSAGTM